MLLDGQNQHCEDGLATRTNVHSMDSLFTWPFGFDSPRSSHLNAGGKDKEASRMW